MKYFPIFVAKKGEMVALQHLTQEVKNDVSPILQILRETFVKHKTKDKKPAGEIESKEFEKSLLTHWSFEGNQILIDCSLFENISDEISRIKAFLKNLINGNINVVPVVQINSNQLYSTLVKELVAQKLIKKICIKFSNNSGGFGKIKDESESLIKDYIIECGDTIILLDLGQVSKDDYNDKATFSEMALQTLSIPIADWNDVVVASSSFPKDLGELKVSNVLHTLPRYENNIWHKLNDNKKLTGLKYGDYGNRSAIYLDSSGHAGTVSLKYTTPTQYLVFKGEKAKGHPLGNGQYINHAKSLIENTNYSGKDFCWGDDRLYEVSQLEVGKKSKGAGNPTIWVQNHQNHHVSLMYEMFTPSN